MSIWSFKINRDPYGRLIKHKACMYAYGVMQKWGVNYWETYSPVFNWISVRYMLTLIIIIELHIKSVDFFLAYTQADVKTEIFMEFPIYFGVEGDHPREWVIIPYKNLYVLKDAGLAWFVKLKESLEARDFFQSQVNPCIWYN